MTVHSRSFVESYCGIAAVEDTNWPSRPLECAPPERWIPGYISWSFSVKYLSKVVAVALFGVVLAGCTGTPMNTQHYESSQYTVLGHSDNFTEVLH